MSFCKPNCPYRYTVWDEYDDDLIFVANCLTRAEAIKEARKYYEEEVDGGECLLVLETNQPGKPLKQEIIHF